MFLQGFQHGLLVRPGKQFVYHLVYGGIRYGVLVIIFRYVRLFIGLLLLVLWFTQIIEHVRGLCGATSVSQLRDALYPGSLDGCQAVRRRLRGLA